MVLKIENLCVSYNNHMAIKDINLIINQGEYVALVGENGSGKSTLIKAIMGLKKQDSR